MRSSRRSLISLWMTAALGGLILPPAPKGAAETSSPPARHYAPDRAFDLLHLKLEVTPDFARRTISATGTFVLRPIARPLREIRLDAIDLRIRTVEASAAIQAWHVTTNQLVITLASPAPEDQEVRLTTAWDAEPKQGLYFRTPEQGYREGEAHLFTQGESITARQWYPCFDAPNERFTSEIICHAPDGMVALSNGRLVARSRNEVTGLTAFHWSQELPHVNYLISLVVGPFVSVEDRHRDIPLAFHVLPSEREQAPHAFRGTREMMAFFEEEIGVPYPWVKYDQVCVNDFVAGGMENTTLTTLTDGTLFTPATETLESSEGLVAHELAHQWFGDLVTCKDWSHLWLNEGFATYYESLWTGHRHGQDHLQFEMFERLRGLTGNRDDTRPIVRRTFRAPDEMFDHLTYPKASWVLHMLRCQLGPELYRRCIRTYLDRHRLDTVVTEDLNAVLEELSGRSWDQFFDQWVYHGGHPELDVRYQWDEPRKVAKISVEQQPPIPGRTLLFRFPLPLRFHNQGRTTDLTVTISRLTEEFEVPLPAAPDHVRVDPDLTVLARIRFHAPPAFALHQLQDPRDVVGRLLAVETLGNRKDHEAVDHLRRVLQEDPFYGVRIEAVRALRNIHSEEALTVLLDSRAQPDARVRREIVVALGGFYRRAVPEALREIITREKNPGIVAPALENLGRFSSPDPAETLQTHLASDSYRQQVLVGALRGCRLHGNPALAKPVFQCLRERSANLPPDVLGEGLEVLASLSRHEESPDAVREFLLGYLEHRHERVQMAALRALGNLGDQRAAGALETFTVGTHPSAVRDTARHALESLRATRPPGTDLQQLREEVLQLKQTTQDLRRQMDELKRPPAATTPAPEASSPPTKPSKARKKSNP